jgi:tetratricopeptide (TPR) repeat protein
MTLAVEGGRLVVERNDARAPFPLPEDRPGYRAPVRRLAEIAATDNRAWITVRWTDVCGFDDQAQARLSALHARTENALGRRLAAARSFDEALPRLARAVQLDPDFAAGAFDLARAQLAAGRAPEALETLEPLIAREPAKVYLECLLDPGLSALLSTPKVAGLAAAPPGSAQLEAKKVLAASQEFSPGRLAAYEPRRRLVAAVERVITGGGEDSSTCPWRSALHIIEAKGGRRLARLALVEAAETAANRSCLRPAPAPEAAVPAIEGRVALANRALAALGFALPDQKKAVAAAPGASQEDPSIQFTELSFPAEGLRLRTYSDGHAELLRADLEVDRAAFVERANWAVYLPEPKLVVYQWGQFPSEGCPRHVYGGIGALKP